MPRGDPRHILFSGEVVRAGFDAPEKMRYNTLRRSPQLSCGRAHSQREADVRRLQQAEHVGGERRVAQCI